MTDLLLLFAALVVAPVGFVLALLVVFIVARDLVLDWRREFVSPPVDGAHPPEPVDSAAPGALGGPGAARSSSVLPATAGPRRSGQPGCHLTGKAGSVPRETHSGTNPAARPARPPHTFPSVPGAWR